MENSFGGGRGGEAKCCYFRGGKRGWPGWKKVFVFEKERYSMRIGRCAAALLAVALLAACGGRREERRPFVYFSNFQRTFNDMNGKHLAAARELGIEPLASAEEVGDASRRLRRVESCRWYEVDKLTHSVPYLVDEAEELLETIGENFRDSLESKGLPDYRVIVTSVLRTDESVARLRKGNVNASANSAHVYGTTFDIAYARYAKESRHETTRDKLKTVLAEVLRDLRKEGRCYVRYEYKQGCFHVTARK